MRVTQVSTNRRYLEHLNSSLGSMNDIALQISSGRKFNRASEDTVSATKALLVRREYDKTQVHISNTEDAIDIFDSVEGVLNQINNITIDVNGILTTAVNGTNDSESRKVYANNIRNLADEIIKSANTEFSGKYVLAGSSNNGPPFTKDGSGNLFFNGESVDKNHPDGRPYLRSELETAFPHNKNVYVDVGYGLQVDAAGNVDPNHALKLSTSGAEVLGNGVDSDGDPLNVYSLMKKAADSLEKEPYDSDATAKLLNKLVKARDNIGLELTNVGDRLTTSKNNLKRLKDDDLNLTASMTRIESVDKESAIIDYKMYEFIYKATLQMGTKIIQPSIFDFMR